MTDREQMEKRQQILRELVEFGKKNGKVTAKEINHAIDELELDSAQQDKFYAALEKLGVEIAMMNNIIAATHRFNVRQLDELRETCSQEVARITGGYRMEDACRMQRRE